MPRATALGQSETIDWIPPYEPGGTGNQTGLNIVRLVPPPLAAVPWGRLCAAPKGCHYRMPLGAQSTAVATAIHDEPVDDEQHDRTDDGSQPG